MTRLKYETNRVLNALDEGAVSAVIVLFRSGMLGKDPAKTEHDNIRNFLVNKEQGLGMKEENADYWLEWYGI